VTSEFAPIAKAGGLADAVASLSAALARIGLDVRVVMPRYGFIDTRELERIPQPLGVPIGIQEEWVGVYRWAANDAANDGNAADANAGGANADGASADGAGGEATNAVQIYLLDHEGAFGRNGIYNEANVDYPDNARRFALLSYGAFQLCRMLGWIPEVVHAHDWPTALVPGYLRSREADSEFARTRSVFTIHNIGYQGIFVDEEFANAGMPPADFAELGYAHQGSYNMLHGALTSADILTTVSPSYAQELQQPGNAFGMEQILTRRRGDLHGVLNGIDTNDWNPADDPAIPTPYAPQDLTGKGDAKAALQRRMRIPERSDLPLVGMIGRLAEQKGIRHLFDGAVPQLCREDPVQFVLLGSGDPSYEERIRKLAAEYRNFGAVIGYNNDLAHLIEAGADFFLMPSEYEPCGLNQMYSMRYGTLPIVSTTGGLKDTVVDESGGLRATGFQMGAPSVDSIVTAVRRALALYRERPERISQMRMVAMQRDFGWESSARRYAELYRQAPVPRKTGERS